MSGPVKPRERLSPAEYQAAKQAGYSDEEIRAEYDVEPGLAMPPAAVADATHAIPNPQKNVIGGVRTAMLHGLEGASLGTGDEVIGAIGGIVDQQEGESFKDAYIRNRNSVRETLDASAEQHPYIAPVSEIIGGAAAPAGIAGRFIKGASLPAQVVRGGVVGTIGGGIAGGGYSRGDDPNGIQPFPEMLAAAGKTAAISGAVGAAAPLAIRGLRNVKQFGERMGDMAAGGEAVSPRDAALLRSGGRALQMRPPALRDIRTMLTNEAEAVAPDVNPGNAAPTRLVKNTAWGIDAADIHEPPLTPLRDGPAPRTRVWPEPTSPRVPAAPNEPPMGVSAPDAAASPVFNPKDIARRIQAATSPARALPTTPAEMVQPRKSLEQMVGESLSKESPATILPETAARVQQGATRGRLRLDEDRLGLPKVTPEPPQGTAHLRGGPDDMDLEAAIRESLERLRSGKQAGYLRQRTP